MKKLFQTSSKVNHLYPVNDSLYLASGFFEKRYAFINNQGEVVNEFGEYPVYWKGEDGIPTEARAMFHQVDFQKKPSENRFVAFSSHVLEICDYQDDKKQLTLFKSILMGTYHYHYQTGDMLSADKGYEVERGIISVSVSSKYIFIVYNESKDYGQNTGSQIRIIDWDGNPVKILKSDKEINCFVIDENEQKGYCIIRDPDDSLVYFDLTKHVNH